MSANVARISHPNPPAPDVPLLVSGSAAAREGLRTDDEDLALLAQERLRLGAWSEAFVGKGSRTSEDLVEVGVSERAIGQPRTLVHIRGTHRSGQVVAAIVSRGSCGRTRRRDGLLS